MDLSDITHPFADLPHFLRLHVRSNVSKKINLLYNYSLLDLIFIFLEDIGKLVAVFDKLNQTHHRQETIGQF